MGSCRHRNGWITRGFLRYARREGVQRGGAFVRSTGRDPFALPVSWVEAKDKLNLDLPLNVATTNEVVGGNSGSPLLNENAELIGLVFDSNLSGRGNAYVYRTEPNGGCR